MIKKLLTFMIMVPLMLLAKEGFSRGHGQGHHHPAVGHHHPAQEHGGKMARREHHDQEHHQKMHEKMKEKIETQHQMKTEKLQGWKDKQLAKCGTDQACVERVTKNSEKRASQIDKQYEKRKGAFEKHDEKHPVEAEPAEGEKAPEGTKAPESSATPAAPTTESR